MTMCDFETVLSLSLLTFGLASTIVLCVAVGTDNWLYTSEPYDISAAASLASIGEIPAPDGGAGADDDALEAMGAGVIISSVTVISMNSGLWRMCFVYDQGDASDTNGEVGDALPPSCSYLDYFDQGFEKFDGADTSISILRGIRKATPVILLSLVLMVAAEVLSIVGYWRHDVKTLVGGVLFIVSALSLAMGQIFYISAVNDEVSQWKKPDGASETQVFTYGYGWAFYAAGSSFLCAMTAAVGHVTQYLGRYSESGDVRNLLIIVPGLSVKRLGDATKAECTDAADPAVEKLSAEGQDVTPSTAEHDYPSDGGGGFAGRSGLVSTLHHSRIATV